MQNLHHRFDCYYVGQIYVEISQNFVAFSESMNFIRNFLCDKNLGVHESKFSEGSRSKFRWRIWFVEILAMSGMQEDTKL